MNFDELKSRWSEQDDAIERAVTLNMAALHALERSKSSVQRASRWIATEVITHLVIVVLMGLFIARHASELKFLIPALLLDVAAIALIAIGIGQLVGLRHNDPGASVVDTQSRIESLRSQRMRMHRWTAVLAPLLWVPMLIVFLKGATGIDAYTIFSTAWFTTNIVFGLVWIPLMLWLAKTFGKHLTSTTFAKQVIDDLAGRNLARSAAFLKDLSHFVR